MSTVYEKALKKHEEWQGKMGTYLKSPIESREDLNLAYTPGVAQPCIEINKNKDDVYKYTWKGNTVAVITDGTAVLGLGDIGPEASLPVMEGKCALLKRFGNVDAVPIALNTKDPKEIIQICKAIAPAFGGFNLEDISAPRCVEIERALIEALDIPVFHDDQHGTAIVVTAGLINALKLVNKRFEDIKVVVSGAGAAGSSIIRMISKMGVKNILAFNINGIIIKDDYEKYDFLTKELTEIVNPNRERLTFKEAFVGADVFIGVSAPRIVSKEMVQSMAKDAIVFSMANPEPEITYADAKAAGAYVVGTGRSDSPNQVNNILAFPGLFRGALDCRASRINEEMKLAAAVGISKLISDAELSPECVIPSAFDPRVSEVVAAEVKKAAYETKVARV
jgi:malate dehydrogenase (oxaloacetate-decarboxylating)